MLLFPILWIIIIYYFYLLSGEEDHLLGCEQRNLSIWWKKQVGNSRLCCDRLSAHNHGNFISNIIHDEPTCVIRDLEGLEQK